MEECEQWSKNAIPKSGFSYVTGKIVHFYHGERKDRDYVDRWKLLEIYNFNPRKDLAANKDGVL